MSIMRKPTREEIQQAYGKPLLDIIAPGLCTLFCGINPGLYSAAVGHHFARPGNRFWPALYAAGLTPRLLQPAEDGALLQWGYGITNIVDRATAGAAELTAAELMAGAQQLIEKVHRYQPHALALLGVSAYRIAFAHPRAAFGRQQEQIGDTAIWVLPNPSGLNAHFQVDALARYYRMVSCPSAS
jgi:TDG/mug DNA glycosylase family protein